MAPRPEDNTDHLQSSFREVVASCGRLRISGWHGLLLVVAVTAAPRFYGLGSRSFHGDEMLTVDIGSSPDMWKVQRQACRAWHPPLHYAIPKLAYLANTETAFECRAAGAAFGVLTTVTAWEETLAQPVNNVITRPGHVCCGCSSDGINCSTNDRQAQMAGHGMRRG